MGSVPAHLMAVANLAPSPLLFDTFTDAEGTLLSTHTPENGDTSWVNVTTAFDTTGGLCGPTISGWGFSLFDIATLPTNYRITGTLIYNNTDEDLVILWRSSDNTTRHIFGLNGANNRWFIIGTNAGVDTVDGTFAETLTTGEYLVRIDISGDTIDCYVGDTLYISLASTLDDLQLGIGFGAYNGVAVAASRCDNIRVIPI